MVERLAAAFSMSACSTLPPAAPAAMPPLLSAEMSIASRTAALASTSMTGNPLSEEAEVRGWRTRTEFHAETDDEI